jgi:DNA polymerase I
MVSVVAEGVKSKVQEKLKKALEGVSELSTSLLASATYDGEKGVAVLKFYEPKSKRIYLWYDNTGHKPYCYTKALAENLKDIESRPDIIEVKKVNKLSLLEDKEIEVSKIIAKDPLAIGGSPTEKSVRNVITAWEADIKYYESYLYDKGLITGALYEIKNSKIVPCKFELSETLKGLLNKLKEEESQEFAPYLEEWVNLLNQPIPRLKRVAIDIEVIPPDGGRMPNPDKAEQQVIAASMVTSDGKKIVYLLMRGESEVIPEIDDVEVVSFKNERDLILAVFNFILDYPFVITFNGDDFDLRYLYNRAIKRLAFDKSEVPIVLGRDGAHIKHGVHIDLYKVFSNKTIQIYAYSNKYSEHTLNSISEAILGESKVELGVDIATLPPDKLAKYCLKDAELTYRLTSDNDDLLLKLLIIIARVARMPIEDLSRIGVSNWIRSLMYYEHRRINALIPRKEELEAKGGASSAAIIKGKKYRGGMVVEPEHGVHFNVAVLDFASLYPSVIKVYNLSYETVNCVHDDCKSNKIPETEHWVCEKRKGLTSLLIGSLRDIRVRYYKRLAKDKSLDEEARETYNVIAQALKVILNASYGVMGAEIFPLYCLPVAEATAAIGRFAITKTIEKCKELGIKVIYGDTDSIFLESPTIEQIDAVTEWAKKELGVELDVDKFYRYVALSQRKKNYLGVLDDGTVDVKGLTGKKSHTPPFIRNAFYDAVRILSRIKSKEDFDVAREEIRSLVKGYYNKLKAREIPPQELAFNVMLGKPIDRYKDTTPQHVKAAKLLERELKKEVKAGEIISFVKTVTPPSVKPIELVRKDEIDVDKYVEYMRATFDQLLDALGYEFEEILGGTKLEDFFWGQLG